MMSIKLEVINVSQCHQRMTKLWPRTTCTKNYLVKFSRAVFKLCEWTDRQTDILITILCTPPGGLLVASAFMFIYVFKQRFLGHFLLKLPLLPVKFMPSHSLSLSFLKLASSQSVVFIASQLYSFV